jgi:hypothetical protein
MSWDVMIFNFESPPPAPNNWEDGFGPIAMGEAEEVRTKISRSLPMVDWSDPAWGLLDGDGFSIEFNYHKSGQVDGFMLHVRGGGDPLPDICRLCRENGWYALDCSTGDFIDLQAPSRQGWRGFQSYRDSIVGRFDQTDPPEAKISD